MHCRVLRFWFFKKWSFYCFTYLGDPNNLHITSGFSAIVAFWLTPICRGNTCDKVRYFSYMKDGLSFSSYVYSRNTDIYKIRYTYILTYKSSIQMFTSATFQWTGFWGKYKTQCSVEQTGLFFSSSCGLLKYAYLRIGQCFGGCRSIPITNSCSTKLPPQKIRTGGPGKQLWHA